MPKIKVPKSKMGGELGQTRYIHLDSKLVTRYPPEGSVDGEGWTVPADKRKADTSFCHDDPLVAVDSIPSPSPIGAKRYAGLYILFCQK